MACLLYGDHATSVEIDDRTLAHLQIVIILKLRRGESFAFSWIEPISAGSGRSTVWLHPSVTLQFRYAGNRSPTLNEQWLAQLSDLANSNGGLRRTPEPLPDATHEHSQIRRSTARGQYERISSQ